MRLVRAAAAGHSTSRPQNNAEQKTSTVKQEGQGLEKLAASTAFFSFCKPCCGAGTIIGGLAARSDDERTVKLGPWLGARGQHRIFRVFLFIFFFNIIRER